MRSFLLPLAFLAGACSLSFEVLWARQTTIEAGGPLASFTIIVASFMLGLVLGGFWFGRIADRTSSPLRLFGVLQCAAAALMFICAALSFSGGAVRPLLLRLELTPASPPFYLLEIVAGGGLACLAALAMGGTLPLLVRSFPAIDAGGASVGATAASVGTMAAGNAAGAAAGALACGFVLLPGLGVARSLLATGGASLAIGACALLVRPRSSTRPLLEYANAQRESSSNSVLFALFLSGLAVASLEIVWTRLAILSFGSSVQAGSLVLSAVIAGLALGNAVGSRFRHHPARPLHLLALLAAGGGLSILLTDPLLGRLPLLALSLDRWLVVPEGFSWALCAATSAQFALMFGLVLIPCLLIGAMFPVGCAELTGHIDGQSGSGTGIGALVGLASAATSAGNLLGGPAAYAGILGGVGSRGCLLASGAMLVLAAIVLALPPPRPRTILAGSVLLLLALSLSSVASPWDPDLLSSGPFLYGRFYSSPSDSDEPPDLKRTLERRGELIFSREGPDALVTVRRSPGGLLSMQVNGKTDASTGGDMKTQMLTAHLPLLLYPNGSRPSKVLVIGLGSGVTAAAALAHPVESVEVVEISPEVVDASRLFDEAHRGAMNDPRMKLTIGDARARLMFGRRIHGGDLFDVIASQPSNPWVAGQALLFTREFFASARSHLAEGGVMCQWVQGYGLEPADFRSVVATFAEVFPRISLWEESTAGGDYLLLGSASPISTKPNMSPMPQPSHQLPDSDMVIDANAMAARMAIPSIERDLQRVEITGPADLLSHFVADDTSLRRFALGAATQTDDLLSLEFSAPRALHRDTLGRILKSLEPFRTSTALLVAGDARLAPELARRARLAKKEREWASGLGLFDASNAADFDLVRAASYLRSGMRTHAMQLLREMTLRRPADRLPHMMLAYLCLSSRDPEALQESIRELQTGVELDPDDARGRLYLARALYAAGRLDDAIEQNRRAALLNPESAEAASDRCAMMLSAGDTASAEAACLEALSRDADLAEAHANLGVLRSRRGRPAEAERSYRRALELDEGLQDTRYNLGVLCERQHRPNDGLAALTPALLAPAGADAQTLRLAARLAFEAGDLPGARDYLKRSVAIEPENDETRELESMLR